MKNNRSRDTTGAVSASRYMQGPFGFFSGGFSWSPRPSLSFDVLFDPISNSYRSNFVGAFNDVSTRAYAVNAGMTWRFGGTPEPAPAPVVPGT